MGAAAGKGSNYGANVLVIGLDNSGKTTVLSKLKQLSSNSNYSEDIVPTLGFKIQKLRLNNLHLTCFDMSGQGRYRNLWQHYFRDCHGIVFVLDSSDKLRTPVIKEELEQVLNSDDIRKKKVPLLFLANKSDSKDAIPPSKYSNILDLSHIDESKPWWICASNALTGEGLIEGFSWLTNQMKTSLKRKG